MSKACMPTMKFFSFIDIKREKNLIRSFEKKDNRKEMTKINNLKPFKNFFALISL